MADQEALVREMNAMAEHIENCDVVVEPDICAGILRCLVDGWTAQAIITEFELDLQGAE